VAALMASGGLTGARDIRADLRRLPLRELDPEPGELSIPVNDKPNPFTTPLMADRYLRNIRPSGNVVQLAIRSRSSWERHADYIASRAFRVVSQIGTDALPGLAVFGDGDGLNDRERAEMIRACLRAKRPLAAISPIDGLTRFLAIDGDDHYASVAIVARSLQHVAIAVAAGPTVAVGTHHTALIQRDGGTWMPAGDLPGGPVLHASIAAPVGTPGRGRLLTGTLFPESGNPVMLNGIVLGGVEASYQPACWPCDSAAIYIAAAASRTTVRAVTGRRLTHPHEVQALLINALRKGEKVPGLIAARDELAAHRLLKDLRRCGIALTAKTLSRTARNRKAPVPGGGTDAFSTTASTLSKEPPNAIRLHCQTDQPAPAASGSYVARVPRVTSAIPVRASRAPARHGRRAGQQGFVPIGN